ncbi:hypothetical protein [Pantoea sp. At-9b]|uniref:hypothetical protein n=1 Tax=Pantoea sp. (strain At-9b) TaxID=592316 RepID=UPI0001B40CF0|nr:hypothetical protein [Pantoea sp. At-9b]ADU72509.1 hypothetical protein Pat9b_4537 [Pantoea sp. At-9b]
MNTAKRIEGRFRQLAEYQGVDVSQLKLALMENYVNQWRCRSAVTSVEVLCLDDDFRRQHQKPVPIYVKVCGLTMATQTEDILFNLPHYAMPYEHCRLVSAERFRTAPQAAGLNFSVRLLPALHLPEGLEWEGYLLFFDPSYRLEPHRSRLLETLKKDVIFQVQQGLFQYQQKLAHHFSALHTPHQLPVG